MLFTTFKYRCKPKKVEDVLDANFLIVRLHGPQVMRIVNVYAEYCNPKLEKCRCKSLLKSADLGDKKLRFVQPVLNQIDTRFC